MKPITRIFPILALLAGVGTAEPAFESAYYKDWPLFSTYARETERTQPIEHFGPVGIGIELLLPPFQMKLSRIDKGSPAEASGKLKVGQMIESINGQTLKDIDPRVILGGIITKAEASDGMVKFMVKEKPDAKAEEVVVNIPVLGAYSKTWPLNCPKSEKIVRGQADFLAKSATNHASGIEGLGLLYMLSTGEEKDLAVAKRWVHEMAEKTKNSDKIETAPWYAGYSGIGLCEYYLRTGDATVIPLIEKNADYLRRNMYNGGWNQRGGVNFGYGHLNAAGVPSTAFLLLARECGAKIDEYTLQESLKPTAMRCRRRASWTTARPASSHSRWRRRRHSRPRAKNRSMPRLATSARSRVSTPPHGCCTVIPVAASGKSGAAVRWGSCMTKNR
jgi:Family of unknown function (DUF6288)